jgi:hypothetical protein
LTFAHFRYLMVAAICRIRPFDVPNDHTPMTQLHLTLFRGCPAPRAHCHAPEDGGLRPGVVGGAGRHRPLVDLPGALRRQGSSAHDEPGPPAWRTMSILSNDEACILNRDESGGIRLVNDRCARDTVAGA